MSKWQEIRFEDIYEIPSRNGLTRPSSVRGEGYNFINMGELFACDRIYDMETELVKLNEKEKRDSTLQEGDLLFARQSLVFEGAGKCSVVMNLRNITSFESHLIRVRLNKTIADPLFYYYYFSLPYNAVKTIVQQCAQAGIRGTDLAKIKVPHSDLPSQKRITGVLSAYDDLIENNNKRIALLEKAAQELYKEWFVRFRFPGYENIELKDSALGHIPENFDVVKMSDVLSYYIGGGWGEEDESTSYPCDAYVIRGTDFPKINNGDWSTCPYRYHKKTNYEARKLEPWDIVLEVSGGTQEQPVGRTLIVTTDLLKALSDKVICASFCKQLRCDVNVISPIYYYYWMQFLYDTRIIDKFQLQSTGIINFKFEYFHRKGDVLLPPRHIMDEFDNRVKQIFKLKDDLALQNRNLIKQRDLLLPRLMSGKLEV